MYSNVLIQVIFYYKLINNNIIAMYIHPQVDSPYAIVS